MNLNTVKLPDASAAILGAGLALGLALRLLDILRPAAGILGQ